MTYISPLRLVVMLSIPLPLSRIFSPFLVPAGIVISTFPKFAALYDGRQAEVASIDPDDAVAAKTHAGTTGGLDYGFYDRRLNELRTSVDSRKTAFSARCAEKKWLW